MTTDLCAVAHLHRALAPTHSAREPRKPHETLYRRARAILHCRGATCVLIFTSMRDSLAVDIVTISVFETGVILRIEVAYNL